MAQDFITIITYTYPHDAELVALKALFDQHQIRYYVMDHHFLGVVPFDTQAIGGVKVRVIQSQAGRATTLLAQLKIERPEEPKPIDEEDAEWMAQRAVDQQKREKDAKRFIRVVVGSLLVGGGGSLLFWFLG